MSTPLTLRAQIELAERRVRIDRRNLHSNLKGVGNAVRSVVSGPLGLGAVFLLTAAASAVGGNKLLARNAAPADEEAAKRAARRPWWRRGR